MAIGDFLSPDQCSIVSWGSVMAWSWTSTVGAGVFLSVAVSYCNPCRTLSSGVTEGRVIL